MMDGKVIIKHAVYEVLVRLWPLTKGRARWLNMVYNALEIRPYGQLKLRSVGLYQLRLDPGDLNDRSFYFGIIGSEHIGLLSRLLRPSDCVIDVGANVGYFSAVAARFVGLQGRVHAIEANPVLVDRLRMVVGEVPQGPIQIHHGAVWHSSGVIPFHVAAEVSGWSSLIGNDTFKTGYTVQVPAVTLDEFVQREGIGRVRLLKLDIEGAETDALRGASRLLSSGSVDYIIVEAEPYRLKVFGHSGEELAALIEGHGYVPLCTIDTLRTRPIEDNTRIPGTVVGDYVYVREALYRPTFTGAVR